MSQRIFRQAALDKLASPEELDKMVQVTNLRGWIALGGLAAIIIAFLVWSVIGSVPSTLRATGLLVRQDGIREMQVAEGGLVIEVDVKPGDTTTAGTVLFVVQGKSGKTQEFRSPEEGAVLEVLVEEGMTVPDGYIGARLEATAHPLQAIVFLSLADGKQVRQGMRVELAVSTVRPEEYGYLLGKVNYVAPYPVSSQSLLFQLKSQELVNNLSNLGPLIKVDVDLEKEPNNFSGFKWTSQSGPHATLSNGTFSTANIVLGEQRPIDLVLPIFKEEK